MKGLERRVFWWLMAVAFCMGLVSDLTHELNFWVRIPIKGVILAVVMGFAYDHILTHARRVLMLNGTICKHAEHHTPKG